MVVFVLNNCLRIKLTFLFFLIAISGQAQQSYSIVARVVDNNNIPLEAVTVKIVGTPKSATTDSNGLFRLSVTHAGSFTIELTNVGFIAQKQSVLAQSADKVDIENIILQRDARQMEVVEVDGRSETRQLKEQGFAVNAIDTRKLANTTADLNEVLNRSTGVKVRQQGGMGSDFEFSVNGLSGSAVKFFIDGVPLDIMGSAMALNNIPVNLADRIEVYKGVAPIELGSDALGGAVNIVTNKSVSNYLDFSHSYGSFQSNQSALNTQYVHQPTGIVIKASGFFNYSKNNYMMHDVETVEDNAFVLRDLPRFNDRYRSVMGRFEVGLVNKSWADALFIGIGYTDFDKQVQTGVRQSIVYGHVTRDGNAKALNLRYSKTGLLQDKLDLSLFANYAKDYSVVADTVLRSYRWDGSYMEGNSETGSFGLSTVDRPRIFTRANVNYRLFENHKLSLNYTLDQIENNAYNAYYMDEDDMPGKLGKHIVGLGYQHELFGRWTNTFMAKYYGLATEKKQYDYAVQDMVNVSDYNGYYGYGIASVYKLTSGAGIKASYENTYRLQDVNEMFGDGFQIFNNLELKPEASQNVNLGLFYGLQSGKHDWFVEALGTYRDVKDFISPNQYANNMIQYQNLTNSLVRGVEGEVRYVYGNWLSAVVNLTYQQAIDNTKYQKNNVDNGISSTYKSEIPNRPWLFGNFDLGLSKNSFLHQDDRLQFNLMTHFTQWYYRSWANISTQNSTEIIPRQLIHSAIVSYATQGGRYNVSFECRNLTNELAFDNFRLQRPGRAFYVKLRYALLQK
ncbi:TonB-dependent receptor plug domain-containing protein [Sphingobacterium sp. DN00404]|uniref:TonB-dependent receptor plug domain-containing protein n=1 Tax=Sphingobacterium micropteri TaxID=2763501 RepID=A0ABR7YLM9_9SPHI|nr:TonB-dependent receptor plug domain-containing protein [Sphingobacterium micropteri]MBD1432088.1 TonB-dependent receptor plug domain-containing protein [Sphingobacterium micropteri]